VTTQACIAWTQAQILTATGKVQRAPNYPDNLRLAVPTAIAWADNIKYKMLSGGFYQTIFDLKIQVVVPLGDLPSIMQFFEGIPLAIGNIFRANQSMGGACSTYEGDVTANFINGEVGGVKCIGYLFTVPNVKLENE
jgi:hypothetical protein